MSFEDFTAQATIITVAAVLILAGMAALVIHLF